MTTTRDIVQRSLRKVGIVGVGQNAPADIAGVGLDDLNMMLAAWKLAAVDITHSALTLDTDFPLAAEYEEGTVHMLAGRIAPDYQFPVGFDPDDFFRKIQAAYAATDVLLTMPLALQHPPSRSARDGTLPLID